MRFGHFDDAAREYVITTPLTPYPWINYLGSQEFFSLISHQAGGYSFYRDARMRRLTRYRYNNVPTDVGGRYLYVNDDGDVWTPSYLPVKAELDDFEARHGLGYTVITGERRGVRVESLFFVPTGENAEVQRVTVTNTSDAAKRLTLFSFVEFALWNALDDQTNYQRNLSIGEVEVEMDSPHGSAIYHKTEYRERRNHFSVHAVNVRAAGFDTDRERHVLIPLQQVRLDREDKQVLVDGLTADGLRDLPVYGGLPIAGDFETRVQQAFGGGTGSRMSSGGTASRMTGGESRYDDARFDDRRFYGDRLSGRSATSADDTPSLRDREPMDDETRRLERADADERAARAELEARARQAEDRQSQADADERRMADDAQRAADASGHTAGDEERAAEAGTRMRPDEEVRIRVRGDEIIVEKRPKE